MRFTSPSWSSCWNQPLTGLFALADEGAAPPQAVHADPHYPHGLSADERARAVLHIDAFEWRLWSNACLTFPEHGLLLADLPAPGREAALSVIDGLPQRHRLSASTRGDAAQRRTR